MLFVIFYHRFPFCSFRVHKQGFFSVSTSASLECWLTLQLPAHPHKGVLHLWDRADTVPVQPAASRMQRVCGPSVRTTLEDSEKLKKKEVTLRARSMVMFTVGIIGTPLDEKWTLGEWVHCTDALLKLILGKLAPSFHKGSEPNRSPAPEHLPSFTLLGAPLSSVGFPFPVWIPTRAFWLLSQLVNLLVFPLAQMLLQIQWQDGRSGVVHILSYEILMGKCLLCGQQVMHLQVQTWQVSWASS